MLRPLSLTLSLTVALFLALGVSSPGATGKFSYGEEIADNGNLLVTFEENGMKRFGSVDYQLDGIVKTTIEVNGEQQSIAVRQTTGATVTPDKGVAQGSLTLTDSICTCGVAIREYLDLTVTNVVTGKVYRLDPIARTFP